MFHSTVGGALKMKKIQKGFTLIELMIVVAIIGILAAVAIPAYQDYIVKAKLTKVQSTLDPIKLALALYYQEQGGFPQSTNATTVWSSVGLPGAPTLPPEVASIAVDGTQATGTNFIIQLTMGTTIKAGSINGLILELTGTAGNTAIEWNCTTGTTITDPIALKYFAGTQANPATCI